MEKAQELVGKTFGRLRVLKVLPKEKGKKTTLECLCSCGNITTAYPCQLLQGLKKSCGCLSKETTKQRFKKHGYSGTKLYQVWLGIKKRCLNPSCDAYKNYGGRGITICEEWKDNFEIFRDFMLKIGYKEGAPKVVQTIERIDVNGNYEPKNCRIASMKEQNINKRNNHLITYKGVTKTVSEFAEDYHLEVNIILSRINNFGYTPEEAIETPIVRKPRKVPQYTVNGETHSLVEWANKYNLTRGQLKNKIRHKSLESVIQSLEKEKE